MNTKQTLTSEIDRLSALQSLEILDTQPEERFDRITRMAARMFDMPVSLVSLVDSDRQWFKSKVGVSVDETPRTMSFCSHAIAGGNEIFCVNDTHNDPRFIENGLVIDKPYIRFYAGSPISTRDGHKIGTLCIIDDKPRELSREDVIMLKQLAQMVEEEILLMENSN